MNYPFAKAHLTLSNARRAPATPSASPAVWLDIGALSCIEESALTFCFDIVCRGTLAEGCALHINTIPAQAWCWSCSQPITVTSHDAGCPHCQSHNLRVDDGDSMQIKQIEIE
ncbi:hydrogenase nickel incorporation protein HybF [Edwardsiella tarda]|nr:hydrogenase nickel incorporation protein HybF [Edwardsiella tarda]